MLLSDYLLNCYLPVRPGMSSDYRKLLAATVRKLEEYVGHPLRVAGVTAEMLASWMQVGLSEGLSATTVNGRRRMIRSLLMAAYDDGFLERPPRRIRRIPESHKTPEAWTIEECRAIFFVTRSLPQPDISVPSFVGEIPASRWWTSLLLTIYWTGCRIGAIRTVRTRDYWPGEGLFVRRQKNGRGQWYPLPKSCCEEIDAHIDPDRELLWPWPWYRSTIWKHCRRIVEAAGVRCPRTPRNLFHRQRRTNLSYCAAIDPAIAQRQADHADYRTTLASYIDPTIARQVSAADVLPEPELPQQVFRVVF